MLKAMPLLDDLAREPARAAGLSRESRSALLSRCAAILAALSALDEPSTDDHIAAGGPAEPERLLTVPEVAELLGVRARLCLRTAATRGYPCAPSRQALAGQPGCSRGVHPKPRGTRRGGAFGKQHAGTHHRPLAVSK